MFHEFEKKTQNTGVQVSGSERFVELCLKTWTIPLNIQSHQFLKRGADIALDIDLITCVHLMFSTVISSLIHPFLVFVVPVYALKYFHLKGILQMKCSLEEFSADFQELSLNSNFNFSVTHSFWICILLCFITQPELAIYRVAPDDKDVSILSSGPFIINSNKI